MHLFILCSIFPLRWLAAAHGAFTATARSPLGLTAAPHPVMPRRNPRPKRSKRLYWTLSQVNVKDQDRSYPWLQVTRKRVQNAMFPHLLNRPDGLKKGEIVQLLIQTCIDLRTLFQPDGKLKSSDELRMLLAEWHKFVVTASIEGPMWSEWDPPPTWEQLTPPPCWHLHKARCLREGNSMPDEQPDGPEEAPQRHRKPGGHSIREGSSFMMRSAASISECHKALALDRSLHPSMRPALTE